MNENIKLYQGDCLEVMDELIAKGVVVDAIITDPPYNIKKAEWDKWKCKKEYAVWLVDVFGKARKLLKDNGSFYFFHNDFLQIVNIQNEINKKTDFVFKQMIVWNKRYEGVYNKGFLDGFCETNQLRNYQQMAEYCFFYTLQDETGLTTIKLDTNNFSSLRKYFKNIQESLGLTKKAIIEKIGQRADHAFRWKSSQWDMPTKDTYDALIKEFKMNEMEGFKEYEELREEYEELREEYEELRYTFNNQKTHHSVWNYPIAKKQGHITPKPLEMMENILLHSTNEKSIVLDMFMGSGSTGVACSNLNRSFIGIELDEKYFTIASERIHKVLSEKEKR